MQLKDLGNAVLNIAPTIAGIFGGPLAATGVQALSSAIFGHPNATGDELQKAIAAGLSPDQLVQIKQADDALKAKLLDAGIQVEQIAAADRASARTMAAATKDFTPTLLALLVIIAWCSVQYLLMTRVLDPSMRELVARVLGTLDAALMAVLNFYFGSSASSSAKNEMLAKALDK